MDKAKAAVSGFLHKDGKHDTTVHETVNPAIQHEHVTPVRHENVTTAVDREVHQDHYHTSVQPIHDKEVLPEKHEHNVAGVQHKTINHGDDSHVKERLAAEAAQFKSTREVGSTQHTSTVAPTVAGEHVHHHVHETIQPVINKEVVQPHVVHTTIPVHETHHNEAKHHTASALPAVSMQEFKQQGGVLGGRQERSDAFEGAPKAVGGTLGGHGAAGTTSLTDPEPRHGSTGTGSHVASGLTGANTHGTHGTHGTHDTHNTHGTTHGTSTTSTTHKPSLIDRLNPMKDTDGDGKKGIMD